MKINPNTPLFQKAVRIAAIQRGLKLQYVAMNLLNVPPQTLSMKLSGVKKFRPDEAELLNDLLRVEPVLDWLEDEQESAQNETQR